MSATLANFLFEVANFLVLAAVLGWVLFKPVRAALEREQERHAEEDALSCEKRTEADRLQQEAREIRAQAEKEAESHRAELMAAAASDVARLREHEKGIQVAERKRFQHEIDAARRIDATQLAETVGKIAAISVRRLLEAIDAPSLDQGLVRAACSEIEALPSASRSGALVETARALDAETHQCLEKALGQPFEERVVETLGAGARITMAGGQVDGTVLAIARHAARKVAGVVAAAPDAAVTRDA